MYIRTEIKLFYVICATCLPLTFSNEMILLDWKDERKMNYLFVIYYHDNNVNNLILMMANLVISMMIVNLKIGLLLWYDSLNTK